MDPVSITTACFGLLSAVAKCARFLTDFVVGCREARNDIAAVSRELSDLDITLHILKNEAEAKELNQLPEGLRQYIRDIMANCTTVLTDFEAPVARVPGPRVGSGRKLDTLWPKEN